MTSINLSADIATLHGLVATLRQLTDKMQAQLNAVSSSGTPASLTTLCGSTGVDPDGLAQDLNMKVSFLPAGAQFDPWYLVTKGTRPGVYRTVDEVNPLVVGVSRSCSQKCASLADALDAYSAAWKIGAVEVLM